MYWTVQAEWLCSDLAGVWFSLFCEVSVLYYQVKSKQSVDWQVFLALPGCFYTAQRPLINTAWAVYAKQYLEKTKGEVLTLAPNRLAF